MQKSVRASAAKRSLVAKVHASCIIGCLATLMPCGKGRVGWACGTPDQGQLSAPQWCGSGTANPYRSYVPAPRASDMARRRLTNRPEGSSHGGRSEDEPCKRSQLRTG